jgi:hypothetical protein
MGAWGTGIFQNDTTADIWGEFKELYNKGLSPKEIRRKLEKEYKPQYDTEYYAEIWTGIAYGQWMCGDIEDYTLKKLKDASKLKWQTIWADDKKDLHKRTKAISGFIEKIQTPRLTPLKRKKIVVRRSFFKKGDVIGIKINGNKHIAAIVTDHVNFDNDGQNTIAFTDFIFTDTATIKEVIKSNMLYLDIGGPNNYYRGFYIAIFRARNMAKQIDRAFIIGKIKTPEFLWLGIGTPFGDWGNIENLIEEQLSFLKRKKSERRINVSVSQFLRRNRRLEKILIEWDKKIYTRKIKPQNAT